MLSISNHHHLFLLHTHLPFTLKPIKSSSSNIQETKPPKEAITPISNDKTKELSSWKQIVLPNIKVAKRVVLVRHGQSTWNAEGRIQGSSDFSVLTQKGEAQAETSRQMLVDDSFDVCFASPLARSKKTAEIIWSNRQEEIITEPDLREIDLYSFQGLLKHEGQAKYGTSFLQWQVDAPNFNIDGHYPVRELWERARNGWNRILDNESRSILVVAHNAVNQALVATAMGLGTEYFRVLLQSNCGVSVLDFTPQSGDQSPHICLNRLNQTASSPISAGNSGGRKTSKRIILVCHGVSQSDIESKTPYIGDGPMNMLGVIQAQKTAELLLDAKVNTVISSSKLASIETANAISQVQEAADCLGADCVPRYVEMKQSEDLNVENNLKSSEKGAKGLPLQSGWLNTYEDEVITKIWDQSEKAWNYLLNELSPEPGQDGCVVAVGHPAILIAMMGHCLNLTKEWLGSFHLDAGSICVVDFPDGPSGRGVVRCINYTAHLGRWSIPITRTMPDDEEF